MLTDMNNQIEQGKVIGLDVHACICLCMYVCMCVYQNFVINGKDLIYLE